MKKFKFNYSTPVWVLLFVVIGLSIVGTAWNIYNVISFSNVETFKAVLYSLSVLIVLFLLVLSVSVCFYGCYTFTEKHLISHFGIISSKIPLLSIVGITHFKKSNKLVIYLKDNKYSVIIISPKDYDEFIGTLLKHNVQISYSSQENDGEI